MGSGAGRPGAGGPGAGRERGAAVVDVVLVLVPLLVLTLGVLQVAFTVYLRTTAVDGVSEGARVGAQFGRTPADGATYAAGLLSSSLGAGAGRQVSGDLAGGGTEVVVTARVPITLFGLLDLGPAALTVHGHAVREQP